MKMNPRVTLKMTETLSTLVLEELCKTGIPAVFLLLVDKEKSIITYDN